MIKLDRLCLLNYFNASFSIFKQKINQTNKRKFTFLPVPLYSLVYLERLPDQRCTRVIDADYRLRVSSLPL